MKAADITRETATFFFEVGDQVNKIYGDKYDWLNKVAILEFARNHYLAVCKRDGKFVGVLMGRLFDSIWDRDIKVLRQELLFSLPKTRASKLLLDDFIDFGKTHADHIITAIGEKSNIKSRSLERLGFSQLEVLYRMETKK